MPAFQALPVERSPDMSCLPMRQCVIGGLVLVHVVAVVGMLLALQCWRSHIPNIDLVLHIMDEQALLRHGPLPDRGCLNTFASYIPPGATWLLLRGVFLLQRSSAVRIPRQWSSLSALGHFG